MFLILLISDGTVFHTAADLTMKDLPARSDSTWGTLRLPCAAHQWLIVADWSEYRLGTLKQELSTPVMQCGKISAV